MDPKLIKKYNVQAPRYTSYPTVPYWENICPEQEQWKETVQDSYFLNGRKQGISLYIHLPFCESLCTYCGCNTRITINHKVEKPYIQSLLNEWSLYLDILPEIPLISDIHLGGGTPTFFNAENLGNLIEGIMTSSRFIRNPSFSFEAHPANTTEEHLQVLFNAGFKRISLGIQDFDPKVQEIINRKQSEQQVREVTQNARKIGYSSVNYDLIYGLPLQTTESMERTIEKVIELHPDRIAFYGYAHVPWIRPGQRKYSGNDLPATSLRLNLYNTGREMLEGAGYREIGMDHFAKPDDELFIAWNNKKLHRNFMGYTTQNSKLLIGLGASSISDGWFGFVQNFKMVEDYQKAVDNGIFPFFKGHILHTNDVVFRQHILNLMCRFETKWNHYDEILPEFQDALYLLEEAVKDGLVTIKDKTISVTEKGKPFLRNICMALDARMHAGEPQKKIFSSSL